VGFGDSLRGRKESTYNYRSPNLSTLNPVLWFFHFPPLFKVL